MNTKKFFGAALSLFFACGVLAGCKSNAGYGMSKAEGVQTRGVSLREDSGDNYNPDDFHAVEIGRNELTVDITELTSTTRSKSAQVTFRSTRLTGWGADNSNLFIVIDDPDYSGSTEQPSMSDKDNPVFHGYTIEMTNKETFKITEKQDDKRVDVKFLVVAETMKYGDKFTISNDAIYKDALVFRDNWKPAIQHIVIPSTVTTIEEGAFQNIPETITIHCEATAKPEGWAANWLLNSAAPIDWGFAGLANNYKTVINNYRQQRSNGANNRYYGHLVTTPTYGGGLMTSVVDDVNFSGDFDNPVRSSYALVKPYKLESYMNSVDVNSLAETVTIPSVITYGADLQLLNTRLNSNLFRFDNNFSGAVRNIRIPKGIDTIEAKAFNNVPDNVHFYVEYTEAEKPIRWVDNWTDVKPSNIHWGVSFTEDEKVVPVENLNKKTRLGNSATPYIIGYRYLEHQNTYYCPDDKKYYAKSDLDESGKIRGHDVIELEDVTPIMDLPVVVYFEVRNKDTGTMIPYWHTLKLSSEEDTSNKSNYYDYVRDASFLRSFDIVLEDNQEFAPETVKLYNIFRQKSVYIMTDTIVHNDGEEAYKVKRVKQYFVPDTSVCFVASANKEYDREVNIKELIDYKFVGLTSFGDYSMIEMSVDKVLDPESYWYKGIEDDVRRTHQDAIDSGELSIRYCFYNLSGSFYRITYKSTADGLEKKVTIPVVTPKSTLELTKDKDNSVSFLLYNKDIGNDFKLENMKSIEFIGLTVNMHLWSNAGSYKIGLTDVNKHFGAIDIMPYTETNPGVFNIILFIVIFLVGLTVLFAAGAIAVYFYLKEKYKNDEFRRMKPKKYLKSAILSYLGTLVIATTVLFIVFRTGLFNNAVSVHNPLDVFIVVPAIISMIVIGYFIKNIVVRIKENNKRKKAAKLKLDLDVAEDGTK